ncbi:MAG: hypothetical protein FWD59_09355, partial [Micrococcales bacterium]|nr:hypothetical protein [Micrococcales bacterium]
MSVLSVFTQANTALSKLPWEKRRIRLGLIRHLASEGYDNCPWSRRGLDPPRPRKQIAKWFAERSVSGVVTTPKDLQEAFDVSPEAAELLLMSMVRSCMKDREFAAGLRQGALANDVATIRASLEDDAAARKAAEQAKYGLVPPAVGGYAGILRADEDRVPYNPAYTTYTADDVISWLEDSGGSRLRLVWGSGGSGKTRLARQVEEVLGESGGWLVHRASSGEDLPGAALHLLERCGDRRVLLIIDYADNRLGLAEAEACLARADQTHRLLLLARAGGDWWERLCNENKGADARTGEVELTPASLDGAAINAIATGAAHEYARILGVPFDGVEVHVTLAGEQPRPLLLHMTALVAVLNLANNPQSDSVAVKLDEVLDSLRAHEETWWQLMEERMRPQWGGKTITLKQVRQAVATVNLLRPATKKEARAALTRSVRPRGATEGLLRLLPALYRGSGSDPIGPVQPDLFAEYLVFHAFAE